MQLEASLQLAQALPDLLDLADVLGVQRVLATPGTRCLVLSLFKPVALGVLESIDAQLVIALSRGAA